MRCPFLRETAVRSCGAGRFAGTVRLAARSAAAGRCGSPQWTTCTVATAAAPTWPQASCPYLHLSLAQSCAAAPRTQYIPATDAPSCRCVSDSHHYCELYVAHAVPAETAAGHLGAPVAGVHVPPHLRYSPNHLWLDIGDDGSCHLGVDEFLTRALGRIDAVRWRDATGYHHPVVEVVLGETAIRLAFPNRLHLVRANSALRADPAKLVSDPYGAGWVFEASEGPDDEARVRATRGLLSGTDARRRVVDDTTRLAVLIHQNLPRHAAAGRLVADGGLASPGAIGDLPPAAVRRVTTALLKRRPRIDSRSRA